MLKSLFGTSYSLFQHLY